MKQWQRNGIVFGGAAFVVTLALNLLMWAARPSDACARGGSGFWITLLGVALFVGLAGAAGWRTTRAGGSVGSGSLAGLLTGAISGLGVVVYFVAVSGTSAASAAQCSPTKAGQATATADVLQLAIIVFGVVVALAGLGIGAAAGAIGGSIGEPRDTA